MKLITTQTVVFISIFVIFSIIVLDYFLVLKSHKTLYENALFVVSFAALSLFIFITVGLHRGIKLRDNIGNLTDHIDTKKLPDIGGGDISGTMEGLGGMSEGLGGLAIAIISAIALVIIAWTLLLSSWFLLILLAAMFYGVYFRALRLVFKKSLLCKGDILLSSKYGILYSTLYTSWIFIIIFALHSIK